MFIRIHLNELRSEHFHVYSATHERASGAVICADIECLFFHEIISLQVSHLEPSLREAARVLGAFKED
ncbi:unnamed protein product, partial [Iphiclides podalirius]